MTGTNTRLDGNVKLTDGSLITGTTESRGNWWRGCQCHSWLLSHPSHKRTVVAAPWGGCHPIQASPETAAAPPAQLDTPSPVLCRPLAEQHGDGRRLTANGIRPLGKTLLGTSNINVQKSTRR
ncbi:unnamed protein product [Boreogadus saida]